MKTADFFSRVFNRRKMFGSAKIVTFNGKPVTGVKLIAKTAGGMPCAESEAHAIDIVIETQKV